jgi:hypothetical protein
VPDASPMAQASYRCRYGVPHTSTIGLTALGQVVQADKDIDLVGTKGRRKEPMPSRKRASI